MILKKSFILIIFVLLLSTPYLIGLSVSTSQVTQTSSNVEFSMRSVLLSEDYAYLLNSIRFTGLYSFEKEWCWSETSGMMCSSSIMEPYHENPWLVMMSFYPILLTLLCVLYGFQKTGFHKKIAFALILGLSILFLFFAKMINPPLGQINEYLFYNFSPFLILFRSAWKYMQIPYILSSIVLIIFGLKELHFRLSKQKKKFYSILAVLFILQIAYIGPAVTPPNQIINKEWITKIPSEYYDLADFINEQEEEFRILPLPLSKHFTGYTPYTWGYTGPDVLYSLIDKPLVDKFHNPVLTQNQINFVTAFENLSYTNLYELLTLAKNVNVKYILLRKDIDINHPYINVWGDPNLIEKSLDRIQEIKNTYEFGNLTLYELAYVPRISIFTDIKKMQRYDAYLQFDSEKYIDYPIEITNQQIDSFSFRIRFLLHNKTDANITDWKEFNHRVIKTDFFKLSVSPKGFIYIFLYNQTKAGKGFTLDVQNLDIMEKEIKMEFYFIDDTFYIVKDGFIEDYSYTDVLYPVGGNINLGGIPNLEKMEGAVYNFSFSINQKQLLDKNNLLSEYKSMAVYEVNENISMDLDEVVKNGNLSLLKESRIEYRNVPIETLNPTKYLIHVNTSSPCTFGFMTSYNKNWIATIYQDDEIIEKQSSRPLFSNLNGFSINSTGNLKIEISYLPQAWFEIGLMITLITGFVGIIIPFYQWKHKFLSIMKNKLKISLKSMLNKNEK